MREGDVFRQREGGTLGLENPGFNKYLGTGQGRQGGTTGRGMHGLGEELLWAAQHGREAQTSGGSRPAGAPSRWTVALRPGKIGWGKIGYKEIDKRLL